MNEQETEKRKKERKKGQANAQKQYKETEEPMYLNQTKVKTQSVYSLAYS
jgi:hypothetical protein